MPESGGLSICKIINFQNLQVLLMPESGGLSIHIFLFKLGGAVLLMPESGGLSISNSARLRAS